MFSKNFQSYGIKFSKFSKLFNNTKFSISSHFSKFKFSESLTKEKERTYGGLKDQDRIFTNLYKDEDPYIEGALKRVNKII